MQKELLNIEEFKKIHDKFKEQGIDTVLIKSIFKFPKNSANLDVLIKPEHLRLVRKILKNEGFIELRNVEEPQKFLFRKLWGGKTILPLHIHTIVGWGVPFLRNSFVWRNLRNAADYPEFYIPSKEGSFLITIAHEFFEDKFIKYNSIIQLGELTKEGIDWELMKNEVSINGWLYAFYIILGILRKFERSLNEDIFDFSGFNRSTQQEIDVLIKRREKLLANFKITNEGIKVPFLISKLFYYKKIIDTPKKKTTEILDEICSTILWGIEWKCRDYFNFNSQKPFLVTFSGIDGSGKTTQAKMLWNSVNECGLRAKYVWLRFASSRGISLLSRFGKKILKLTKLRRFNSVRNELHCTIKERKNILSYKWIMYFWQFLTLLEFLPKILLIRLYLLLGYFVICDRYILDAVAEMGLYCGKENVALYLQLLKLIFPKPDYQIYLQVERKSLNKRQIDEEDLIKNPALVKEFLNLYNLWRERVGINYVLHGDDKVNKIAHKITVSVLNAYFQQFKTLIRRLLKSNPNQLNKRL